MIFHLCAESKHARQYPVVFAVTNPTSLFLMAAVATVTVAAI